jgi:hypothetical protein
MPSSPQFSISRITSPHRDAIFCIEAYPIMLRIKLLLSGKTSHDDHSRSERKLKIWPIRLRRVKAVNSALLPVNSALQPHTHLPDSPLYCRQENSPLRRCTPRVDTRDCEAHFTGYAFHFTTSKYTYSGGNLPPQSPFPSSSHFCPVSWPILTARVQCGTQLLSRIRALLDPKLPLLDCCRCRVLQRESCSMPLTKSDLMM